MPCICRWQGEPLGGIGEARRNNGRGHGFARPHSSSGAEALPETLQHVRQTQDLLLSTKKRREEVHRACAAAVGWAMIGEVRFATLPHHPLNLSPLGVCGSVPLWKASHWSSPSLSSSGASLPKVTAEQRSGPLSVAAERLSITLPCPSARQSDLVTTSSVRETPFFFLFFFKHRPDARPFPPP